MAWFGKSAKSLVASGHAHMMKAQYDRAVADFNEAIKKPTKTPFLAFALSAFAFAAPIAANTTMFG